MDKRINELMLLLNTYLEHHSETPIKIITQEGFSDINIKHAIEYNYIKKNNKGYMLTEKGEQEVREQKKDIDKNFDNKKKEFYDSMKIDGRIVPKTMKYRLVYSQIICPLCGKINLGSKYTHNICAECDAKITQNTTKWNKLKSKIKKPNINWVLVGGVVGILALIFVILDFSGYGPTNILTPKSELKVDISSIYMRELKMQLGDTSTLEIFNPSAQGDNTGLNLWLENKGGRTTIYTQTINIQAENFGTRIIETQQYEIKPDQSIQIPLKFYPSDSYWLNKSISEKRNAQLYLKIKITYTTKGKTTVQEYDKTILSDVSQYYNSTK